MDAQETAVHGSIWLESLFVQPSSVQAGKIQTKSLFFAGVSDGLPCMWPTFAGGMVKRGTSMLRVCSGVVEWRILQPWNPSVYINKCTGYIYICRYTGCINMIHVCILTPTMKINIDIMIIVMRHQHHKHHRQENNSPKDVRAGTPGSDFSEKTLKQAKLFN